MRAFASNYHIQLAYPLHTIVRRLWMCNIHSLSSVQWAWASCSNCCHRWLPFCNFFFFSQHTSLPHFAPATLTALCSLGNCKNACAGSWHLQCVCCKHSSFRSLVYRACYLVHSDFMSSWVVLTIPCQQWQHPFPTTVSLVPLFLLSDILLAVIFTWQHILYLSLLTLIWIHFLRAETYLEIWNSVWHIVILNRYLLEEGWVKECLNEWMMYLY